MNDPGQSYFDVNYPNYEAQNSPGKLAFYLNLLRRWVPEGSEVFELGTGLGNFMQVAAPVYRCQGCDPNQYAIDRTRQKVSGVQLLTGSFETLAVGAAPDAVVSWDVLEHIPELDQAMGAIYGRLKPGGYLIGVVPVYDGPLGWLVRRLDHDPTHVWKRSRHWWRQLLASNGFELADYGGILRKLVTNGYYLHWTRPQWLWRGAGCALYFVARKSPTP